MPTLPACGTILAPQTTNRIMQISNPPTDPAIAPIRVTFLLNIPQMNGPKKTDAIAPQEIESIVTITAGLKKARIIESNIKNMLPILTSDVNCLSFAFLLINPL